MSSALSVIGCAAGTCATLFGSAVVVDNAPKARNSVSAVLRIGSAVAMIVAGVAGAWYLHRVAKCPHAGGGGFTKARAGARPGDDTQD